MTGKRPDLAKLSPEEKNALIRDLWRQVAAGLDGTCCQLIPDWT